MKNLFPIYIHTQCPQPEKFISFVNSINWWHVVFIYLFIYLFSNSVMILKTFRWEREYRFFPTLSPSRYDPSLTSPHCHHLSRSLSLFFPLSFWYSCRQRGGVQCGTQAAYFVNDDMCLFFSWLECRKLVTRYVCHLFDKLFHIRWIRRAFDAVFN